LTPPDVPPIGAAILLHRFRASLNTANFRSFLVGRSLAMAGFSIAPFIAVYYTSQARGRRPHGACARCLPSASFSASLRSRG